MLVELRLVEQRYQAVLEVLDGASVSDVARRFGVARQMVDAWLVCYGGHGLAGLAVLFDRICHNNGIRHILTKPHSPTTTGKVERWHKTLRAEFLSGKVFASLSDAQAALDGWVDEYNHRRPHPAIGRVPPFERF